MAEAEAARRWRQHPGLVEEELDGERVVWDPASGRVARLDRIGSLVWACLDGSTGLDELSGDLADAFAADPGTVRADVEQLVARLAELGFLISEPDQPI
ncbi:MAG: PqqD family protein [Acidimicrobiales bacterium]